MAGSTIGTNFKITTWGESHGTGIGVVIDGCPAGLSLCEEDIQTYLNRRKPGQSAFSTPRKEDDAVHILSGVFEGRTTGTPISLIVVNENQHSKDYSEIASYYRPGHADFTFDAKYGFRDYRGGGRSSGRETIGRVAAGAVAAKILKELGIDIIWLSPIYKSPFVDQGYDISDYYKIAEEFGTMEEFDELLAEAKKRDMYIVMDLVVNHCSDQHEWFQKALADPDGEYADYFYFVKGKDGKAPSNYRSYFGGSTWEKVPNSDKYYLHMFAKEQPDLNWENPVVRQKIYEMVLSLIHISEPTRPY